MTKPFNPRDLAKEFASMVGEQLDERDAASNSAKAQAELTTAILAKPILHLPEDLMTIVGCGRSAAYVLMRHPNFCPTFTVARQRLCRTGEFLACLPGLTNP